MEQFSLEKYLANPSRKVVTRDGRRARIIYTDAMGDYPIVALIESFEGTAERADSFTSQGSYYIGEISNNDLFFDLEKHEGWINVYRNSDSGHTYTGAVYDSKEDAKKRKIIDENYVTTIKIEWED